MTKAGTLPELPTMPAKANVERVRDAGAKKGGATAMQDAEAEFSDLLSKLKVAKGQVADESASAEKEKGGEPRDASHIRRRAIDAGLANPKHAGEGGDRLTSDKGGRDGLRWDAVTDPTDSKTASANTDKASATENANALPANAAGPPNPINGLAAIVTLVSGQQTSKSNAPHAAAPSSGGSQPADARAAEMAVAAGHTGSVETAPALQVARAIKGQSDTQVARAVKGQSDAKSDPKDESKTRTSNAKSDVFHVPAKAASAETASTTPSELPTDAQVPKTRVLATETHFAPVSRPPRHVHVGHAAGNGGPTKDAVASASERSAPAVDSASTPSEEPIPASLQPVRQIADQIATEAADFRTVDGPNVPPDQPGMKPALKVLHIQLQPADLGTVTVRMELRDTGLTLHVEADRSDTADAIRSDQDTLSKLLRSAGYGVDPGAIRVVDGGGGDRSVTPTQAGQQQGPQTNLQSSTQSQSGWSGRQDQSQPQRGNAGTNGGDAQIPTSRNGTHETTPNRSGRGLYI